MTYEVDHDPAAALPWRVVRIRDVGGVTVREVFAYFREERDARERAAECSAHG